MSRRHAKTKCLKIVVVVLGKRLRGGSLEFLFVLVLEVLVELELWGLQGRCFDKVECVVAGELAGQPQERLFEVVVRLGRNIIILQVLLAVEGNLLRLHLTVLDLHFISAQYNGNIFANPSQITVPVRNILVSNTRGHVEHDDSALALNVISVTKTSKFLLQERKDVVVSNGKNEWYKL